MLANQHACSMMSEVLEYVWALTLSLSLLHLVSPRVEDDISITHTVKFCVCICQNQRHKLFLYMIMILTISFLLWKKIPQMSIQTSDHNNITIIWLNNSRSFVTTVQHVRPLFCMPCVAIRARKKTVCNDREIINPIKTSSLSFEVSMSKTLFGGKDWRTICLIVFQLESLYITNP